MAYCNTRRDGVQGGKATFAFCRPMELADQDFSPRRIYLMLQPAERHQEINAALRLGQRTEPEPQLHTTIRGALVTGVGCQLVAAQAPREADRVLLENRSDPISYRLNSAFCKERGST